MKLFEAIQSRKTTKDNIKNADLNAIREQYKKDCLEHWQKNKEAILDFFARSPVVHDHIVFISYHKVHQGGPLCNIPISKEIWDEDDDPATAINSLTYYFDVLQITFTERGSSSYSTCDKDFETKNGLEVDLNSDVSI